MARKSFYDMLLVDQNATLDEIRLAFKRRALQVHPDKGGSKEEFHSVYQALETLGDPVARKKYDHTLTTIKSSMVSHAKSNKEEKARKQNINPATRRTSEKQTRPQMPGRRSTTPKHKTSTRPATTQEPQSEQTKLLTEIRDLLRQLPRDTRSDVITKQFSQKQRLLLEKWMVDNVDNVDTSAGTRGHSEVKVLALTGKNAPCNTPDFETSSHMSCLVASGATSVNPERRFAREEAESKKGMRKCPKGCNEPYSSDSVVFTSTKEASETQSLGSEAAETCMEPHPRGKKETNPSLDVMFERNYALAVPNSKSDRSLGKKRSPKMRSSGSVKRAHRHSRSYNALICFDSLEIRAGYYCDLKTALDNLVILTSVKQKMRDHRDAGAFTVEHLHEAMVSAAGEHGRNIADLKPWFTVLQYAGCFIGACLRSPSVRSLEVYGKMRAVLEPFRIYSKCVGGRSVYWRYSPVHLEDAWQRFQGAVAKAWTLAEFDSVEILQKIRSLYEARASFRRRSLQRWEQQHMAMQDKKGRERNVADHLGCWERRQMALHDKNRHRPRRLRERNPTGLMESWERKRMAMEDRNKHRPRKMRLKSQLGVSRQLLRRLSSLRKLIRRWGCILKKEATKAEVDHKRVLRERRARQKNNEEERRLEALKQKRKRTEERLRRERLSKRMRSELTMDDILGPKYDKMA